MNIARRHLPYRQLLTAGRCVNAPPSSPTAVTAARHNVAARQYPILLAFCLALGTLGFLPGTFSTGGLQRPHYHTVCTMVYGWYPRPHAVCRRVQVRP